MWNGPGPVVTGGSGPSGIIERSSSIAYLGLLLTVGAVFVLPLFLPIPPALSIALAVLGFVFTMFAGRGGVYSVIAGAIVAYSLVGLFIRDAAIGTVHFEEPIPVPSGYGFELHPESTNLHHMYLSEPMSPMSADRAAAEDIVDYYVTSLAPEWTVLDRQNFAYHITVTLKEADSSHAIRVRVDRDTSDSPRPVLELGVSFLECRDGPTGLVCIQPLSEQVPYRG